MSEAPAATAPDVSDAMDTEEGVALEDLPEVSAGAHQ